MSNPNVVNILKRGGIGVMATDTLYGVVASALNRFAVERVYHLRKRNPKKPFIILISSLADLKKFGIRLNSSTRKLINSLWPGKVSVVLPCPGKSLEYLHRGTKTLAFRLPKPANVRNLLKKTGPLVAPSANPEGKNPALTIAQAKKYFKNAVDFYKDGGKRTSKPSTLVALKNGKIKLLRPGAVIIRNS